jgi:drug/metabolite transporter (DMT)-like permease
MSGAPAGHGLGLPSRVMIAFGLSVLVWGSTWTAIRYQLGTTAPAWSIAFRFTIAATAMALYARWQGLSLRIRSTDLPLVLAIGAAQFALNFLLLYNAERFIASGLVAMLFALLIVPNAVLGRIFLGHRVGGGFVAGTLVATVGMVLLFHDAIAAVAGGGGLAALGILLTLGATLSASVGNLLQASPRAAHLNWAGLLVWSMGSGAVIDAVAALLFWGPPVLDPRPEYWAATFYLGLVGSALTFPVYLSVIRALGPARAAYSGVVVPIVAMAFSTLLEGYRWTPSAVAGSVLGIAGLVIALRGKTVVS